MDCHCNISSEFMRGLYRKATENRIPIMGSFELTHRCNLRCKHCYLGCQTEVHKKAKDHELDTTTILKIIDEITEAGCLELLLTGGDPLTRKDFPTIYQHVINNGMLAKLYTNGTLITPEILDLLKTYPPLKIEITLYGATEKTYENITGVQGSYKKCLQGIEKLLSIQAFLELKTVVLTLNQHEFYAIEKIAKDWGVPFRYACIIQPQLNRDKSPLKYRIDPEKIMEIDFSEKERQNAWIEQDKKYSSISLNQEKLYSCGAGIYNFHIDPYGNLMPCMLAVQYKYNLISGNFSDGWNNFISKIRDKQKSPEPSCRKCINRHLCDFCPAVLYLENGAESKPSQYLCKIGRMRRKFINRYKGALYG